MSNRFLSLFAALALVLSFTAFASAEDQKVTLTGNVVDKACSTGFAKKDDPQAAAAAHSKACALKDSCSKSGYGVYADGKFTEFDEKGNTLAKAALEKTTKAKGAKFAVAGTIKDGKMAVESITEVE